MPLQVPATASRAPCRGPAVLRFGRGRRPRLFDSAPERAATPLTRKEDTHTRPTSLSISLSLEYPLLPRAQDSEC